MQVIDFIVNQILREPSIFMGIIVLLGMLFLRKDPPEILASTLKTIVGVRLVQVAADLLINSSKPVMDMLVLRFGLEGRVADPWTGVAEGLERMAHTNLAGQVGLIMVMAWLLHLVFSRLTPFKVVYLTGHIMFSDTVLVTFFVFAVTGWTDWRAVALPVLLLAFYWWFWPSLMRKPLKVLVGEDNLTLGHDMVFFGWLAFWIAKWTGDTRHDTEELEFPGWLSIMRDTVVSYSLIMATLYTLIGILAGPEVGGQFSGEKNYIIFAFIQGINTAAGITLLMFGVRMFLAELLPAFEGFAKVVVPGAVPAVDVPAFWAYAPQAALLGMVFTLFGMLTGILLQILLGMAYITIPGVIPLFSGGCTLGALASRYGGVRGTIIATFVLGIVQVFGSIWLAEVVGFEVAGGGHMDYCTYWPALLTVLKIFTGG
jgi:PTS system ascorbate-specific IIC component